MTKQQEVRLIAMLALLKATTLNLEIQFFLLDQDFQIFELNQKIKNIKGD